MAARPRGGADSRCPACRAPILRQLVGHRAALQVTADLTPLAPDEQARARGPNSLIWCLHTGRTGSPELRWIHPWHPPDCDHPHVAEHHCTTPHRTAPPVGPPDTLF